MRIITYIKSKHKKKDKKMDNQHSFSSPYPLDNLRIHKDDLKIVRKIQKKKR